MQTKTRKGQSRTPRISDAISSCKDENPRIDKANLTKDSQGTARGGNAAETRV